MAALFGYCFFIYLVNSVLAHTRDDIDYTKCISENQAAFIHGIENLVKSSDPLEIDVINIYLPDLNNTLRNIKLKGLKDCAVVKLRINTVNLTFEYNLECKKLAANGQYLLRGRVADIYVEGDGNVTVTTGFYVLMFHGQFEKNVNEDMAEYAYIKNYYLDFEARENLVFNFTNLYGGDHVKSDDFHKFVNENWTFLDKKLRAPVLSPFMEVFIDHLNGFLKVTPIEKVFPIACGVQN